MQSKQNALLGICYKSPDSLKENDEAMVQLLKLGFKEQNCIIIGDFNLPELHWKQNIDLNQLIYNCGGILGLWFGLSSLSIDDLFTILKRYSVRLNIKVIVMKNLIFYSIYELKRRINILHRMFKNFNINMNFTIEIEY